MPRSLLSILAHSPDLEILSFNLGNTNISCRKTNSIKIKATNINYTNPLPWSITHSFWHAIQYIYIYTYVYIYIYICIGMCVYIYIYIYIYIHIRVCVYIYIYIYLSIYLSLSLSIYIYIHIYIYMRHRSAGLLSRASDAFRGDINDKFVWPISTSLDISTLKRGQAHFAIFIISYRIITYHILYMLCNLYCYCYVSGGRLCALIGVPWRGGGSVLAPSAWGDCLKSICSKRCWKCWACWDARAHLWEHANDRIVVL